MFVVTKDIVYLCNKIWRTNYMTTMQINAQIQQGLNILKDDEGMMQRVAKYIQKLVTQKQKEEDLSLMTKEEFFAQVDEALSQAERGEGIRVRGKKELQDFLNSL